MQNSTPLERKAIARSYLAGYIAWLPPKDPSETHRTLTSRCYNHPVVILSPRAKDGEVVVLILTSLGMTDLAVKYESPQIRKNYLPIAPSNPHPDNNSLLRLDNEALSLSKKSYVNTATHHTIMLTSLHQYNRGHGEYVLSKKSYLQLVEYTRYVMPNTNSHQSAQPALYETIPRSMHSVDTIARGNVLSLNSIPDLSRAEPVFISRVYPTTSINSGSGFIYASNSRTIRINNRIDPPLQHHTDSTYSERSNLLGAEARRSSYSTTTFGTNSAYHRSSKETRFPRVKFRSVFRAALSVMVLAITAYAIYRAGVWTIWGVGAIVNWTKQFCGLITGKLIGGYNAFINMFRQSFRIIVEKIFDVFRIAKNWVTDRMIGWLRSTYIL